VEPAGQPGVFLFEVFIYCSMKPEAVCENEYRPRIGDFIWSGRLPFSLAVRSPTCFLEVW